MPKPPGLLFLMESFLPELTGAATQAGLVAEQLAARGHRVIVVCRRSHRDLPAREKRGAIEVWRIGPYRFRRFGKYLMLPGVAVAIWRLRRQFEILLVCSFKITGVVAVPTGRALKKPVILRAELNGEMDGRFALDAMRGWRTKWLRPLARRLIGWRNRVLRSADAFLAISSVIEAEYRACNLASQRLVRVANGVDTRCFAPVDEDARLKMRRELGLPEAAWIVAYSGRLTRGKGVESLVEAFAAVAATSPRPHLLLIGTGAGWTISIEPQLRAQASGLGLDGRVIFAGHRHDVDRWLKASDLFAFLSEDESLGISLIEAQACALPCVATRVGGIPDVLIDGETGILVPPRDAAAAGRALALLLADPARAARLGRAARQRAVEKFAIEPLVGNYQDLFATLVGEWRNRPDAAPPA